MRVVVFGASGMVGIEVLHQCLDNSEISHIDAVVRRPLGVNSKKLTETLLADFDDMSSLQQLLAASDACFYCVGVYQGRVPDEIFWKVTIDYQQELLDQMNAAGASPIFCLFSAAGADPSEKRFSPLYARAKGRAEQMLVDSEIEDYFIVRPGYINPGRKSADSRIPDWLARPVYKLFPFIGIDAADIARTMVEIVLHGHPKRVLENRDLRTVAETLRSHNK